MAIFLLLLIRSGPRLNYMFKKFSRSWCNANLLYVHVCTRKLTYEWKGKHKTKLLTRSLADLSSRTKVRTRTLYGIQYTYCRQSSVCLPILRFAPLSSYARIFTRSFVIYRPILRYNVRTVQRWSPLHQWLCSIRTVRMSMRTTL